MQQSNYTTNIEFVVCKHKYSSLNNSTRMGLKFCWNIKNAKTNEKVII